ncbi:MAG: helix-hairpin-helix domain-containing protein [Bacteroidetes bacterium]|nr:helix-hairpin-helix domain-containing protein [Bacteroidota bacterium]
MIKPANKRQAAIRISLSKKNQRGHLLVLVWVGFYWLIPQFLKDQSDKENLLINFKVLSISTLDSVDSIINKRSKKLFSSINKKQAVTENSQSKKVAGRPLTTKKQKKIELNAADSLTLMKLQGIGPVLSARIVKYRDKLGGFHSTTQLKEVYGLPDSTFQKISDQLELLQPGLKKIAINKADEKTIAQHPYIGWKLAKLIVRYRQAHGNFYNYEQLNSIWGLENNKLDRLLPYLSFDSTNSQ